ncbi:tropomodulin [Trichonephila clavipes]|nr:tropomodulin [Trichonephila clavipes]
MAAPIQNPAKCDVRSVIRFLHAKGRTDVHDEQRTGQPSVISDALLQRKVETICANRRLKLKELHQIIPEVSMTTLYEVVTVKLGYRKLCARWVPKMLTVEHKKKRMGFALDFLTCYAEAGDEFLDHIVTGDEMWVLVEALKQNKTLISLNVESNYLSGSMIRDLLDALLTNQTVLEFRAANQSPVVLGNKIEMEITKIVEENKTLLRLGLCFDVPDARVRITEHLQKNNDRIRLRRIGCEP